MNILDMTTQKQRRSFIASTLILCITAGTFIGCTVRDISVPSEEIETTGIDPIISASVYEETYEELLQRNYDELYTYVEEIRAAKESDGYRPVYDTSLVKDEEPDFSFLLSGSDIVIPDNFTAPIGGQLFLQCKSEVTSINYGNNGTDILDFSNIPSTVLNLYASDDNCHFKSIDGVLFSIDGKILLRFPIGRTGKYSIPEGCEEVAHMAFTESKLTSVYFPDSVNSIRGEVFVKAEYLTELSLPSGIDYHDNIDMFPLEWVEAEDGMGGWLIKSNLSVHYRGTLTEWQKDFQYCRGAEYMNVIFK